MTRRNRIISEIKELANQIFANLHASVYLYGSQARGDATSNSDWDILIVTDDNVDKTHAYEKFAYPFTEIGWKLGEQITPLLYTQSEWKAESDTSFYLNVQKDAILL